MSNAAQIEPSKMVQSEPNISIFYNLTSLLLIECFDYLSRSYIHYND